MSNVDALLRSMTSDARADRGRRRRRASRIDQIRTPRRRSTMPNGDRQQERHLHHRPRVDPASAAAGPGAPARPAGGRDVRVGTLRLRGRRRRTRTGAVGAARPGAARRPGDSGGVRPRCRPCAPADRCGRGPPTAPAARSTGCVGASRRARRLVDAPGLAVAGGRRLRARRLGRRSSRRGRRGRATVVRPPDGLVPTRRVLSARRVQPRGAERIVVTRVLPRRDPCLAASCLIRLVGGPRPDAPASPASRRPARRRLGVRRRSSSSDLVVDRRARRCARSPTTASPSRDGRRT